MGILRKSRALLTRMIEISYSLGQLKGEIEKDIDPRRVKKYSKVILSDEQKKAIDEKDPV